MAEHRIRLSDDDLSLIVAALNARRAMTRGARRHRIERLYERLSDLDRGNPKWRLNEYRHTHEEEIGDYEDEDA